MNNTVSIAWTIAAIPVGAAIGIAILVITDYILHGRNNDK